MVFCDTIEPSKQGNRIMKHTFHLTKKEANDALMKHFDLHPDTEIIIEGHAQRNMKEVYWNNQTSNTHPNELSPEQMIEVVDDYGGVSIGTAKSFGLFWNTGNVIRPHIISYRLID
jgi:hypothetical protein